MLSISAGVVRRAPSIIANGFWLLLRLTMTIHGLLALTQLPSASMFLGSFSDDKPIQTRLRREQYLANCPDQSNKSGIRTRRKKA